MSASCEARELPDLVGELEVAAPEDGRTPAITWHLAPYKEVDFLSL
jgi:hypothetical protein